MFSLYRHTLELAGQQVPVCGRVMEARGGAGTLTMSCTLKHGHAGAHIAEVGPGLGAIIGQEDGHWFAPAMLHAPTHFIGRN